VADGKLQLEFTISPDEDGVFDGRDLARGLVQAAYRLLVPYTKACPACTDALFSAVANDAISEILAEPELTGTMMVNGNDLDHKRFLKHMAETQEFTESLLKKGGVQVHEHD
jgi:hypothetical protein